MDALQETILDRLMAADRIGAMWTPGPLRLACEAVQGAGLSRGITPDEALGYPLLFCRALEGASGVLATVDEVRTLAITIFSEVPPRPQPPTFSPRRQIEIGFWCVRQVHLYHDDLPGPSGDAPALLERYLAGHAVAEATIDALSRQLTLLIGRVKHGDVGPFRPGRLALSAYYFAVHALRLVLADKDPNENAGRSSRDVARLATLSQGLDGAVPYCLALAQTLGM